MKMNLQDIKKTVFGIILVVAHLLSACGSTPANVAEPIHPPHIVRNSELRILPSGTNGRHYQLHIGLPDSYTSNSNHRYSVVYVTDAYWDFEKIMAIRGTLVYDRVVPEFIVVGLGYAGEGLDYGDLRRLDLSPVPLGEPVDASGRADDFLQFIKAEVIPFIEQEYRVDSSYRVLAGSSLGGLFTLFSMYTEPGLFQGYIAAAPAVALGDQWLFDHEENFSNLASSLAGRLYLTVGEHESPDFKDSVMRMNSRIASRQYVDFAMDFRVIEGERHGGMQFESYVRGLRFVLAPLATESEPLPVP